MSDRGAPGARRDVLVCAGGGCVSCRALALASDLENLIHEAGLDARARVVQVGCMGQCEAGRPGYPTGMLAPSALPAGNFIAAEPKAGMTSVMADVVKAKDNPNVQLRDTRETSEWTGEELKKGAFRKGRIPWARFLNWKEFKKPVVDGEKFTEFKPAADVQAVIAKHGLDRDKDQIFYCQSAVRTTTHIFALYMLGWDITELGNYDGSWIEWSYHKDNPVVVEVEKTQ